MPVLPRLNRRVTVTEAGRPKELAPTGTTGTFIIQALGNNTGAIALGGEPNLYAPTDKDRTDGPISAALTQNAPLFDAGYSLIFEGDLGTLWVDTQKANEGVCWLRIK